ncbi:MAG: DNA topoisomerase (ATP-hydrolyzing) [Snowella sp.]|nr:DNA topoisomerase (ATP-hydrolyzing) [Snowella sp.]
MTTQLKLLATGQIIPTALHLEMERSYLEYAMSVIVGRALPDVRDGLKPVHRRILYAMYELGLTPDRPFRKCARVVGDVLGKYHPHGDQSVYDALVRLVQDFSSRYPLLSGHGNFGSVDNDPPAAMRYTETRLAPIALGATLQGISEAIVDFTSNFDNSQQEPTVLPTQLPILLLNGCSGIAVGMATNIPPHNLSEVVDGLIALIDKADLTDAELWRYIPGPDFPTGGEILDSDGIESAYSTGRGLIPVRGVAHLETVQTEKRRNRQRTAIIVTELPFQVNKAAWIEKVAELVNGGKIEGIADLRDESDRTGMRVVIELKRDIDPQTILEKLYKNTALQSNFGVIFLALVNNKPVQLSLRQILEEFLKFREETLTRQYGHELGEATHRRSILEGLLIALNQLDVLIEVLRFAPDGTSAKMQLQSRLELTENQAEAILAMPMRRITGLERQKLQQEHDQLQSRIEELERLLSDRPVRLKALKKELRSLKKQFADPRRTKILKPIAPKASKSVTVPKVGEDFSEITLETPLAENLDLSDPLENIVPENIIPESTIAPTEPITPSSTLTKGKSFSLFTPQPPPENALINITAMGKIYWCLPEEEKPKTDDDPVIFEQVIPQEAPLIIVSDRGKAYPVAVKDIPPLAVATIPLLELLPPSAQKETEKAIGQFFVTPDLHQDLLLLTCQGRLKRLFNSELQEVKQRGLSLLKLRDDDRLQFLQFVQSQQALILATSGGRLLRFSLHEDRIVPMSRQSQGAPAVRLRPQESLVGSLGVNIQKSVLLLTAKGYGKALGVEHLRQGNLGDIGTTAIQFTHKSDRLLALLPHESGFDLRLQTNLENVFTLTTKRFSPWGKDGSGDRLVKLQPEEWITQITYFSQPIV